MNLNLLQRLKDNEDNFTERKLESARRPEFKKTIVAFANSVRGDRTGILFIGIADDGTIQGVTNPDPLQKTIRKICNHECYPPITFLSQVLSVEGKDVVAVEIPESNNRPHFAGPAYVREGSESVSASEELFEELITSRNDLGREILKHKGEKITVVVCRKKLGSPKNLGAGYRARHECRVEACNPHYVTLYEVSTNETLIEPLRNVTISFDCERSRFQLDVEPR